MGKWGNRFGLCLVVVLLTTIAVGPRAEVAADTQHGVILLVLGITEGPDPIPQVWEPVRFDDEPGDVYDLSLLLNHLGGPNGDGRPDDAVHPVTNWAHVVWAKKDGSTHDIAYGEWVDTQWVYPENDLTDTEFDEVDPRISISPGGTIYVVWWDADLEQIWMSTRATGISAWGVPEQVTGLIDSGRRPSILEFDGSVLTAYERNSIRFGQEVVVATRVSAGVYTTEVVATTLSDEPLNVILHDEDGKLWIDWQHSDTEYAYSVFTDGGWGEKVTLPWIADSWTRAEEARQIIRRVVLSD